MWKSKALIIPLFYHIQPFQFRIAESESQGSRYGEALREHYSKGRYPQEAMEDWKRALCHVSSLPGWMLDSRSCSEGELVKRVVCDIISTLDKIPLHNVAKHPVQLDNKIQEVSRLLNLQNQADVVTVGIWGMGGCGKTTIAKAVFNHIVQCFDSWSFLSDVRNMSQKQFQEQIIRDTNMTCAEISASQRALVVLDNIDDSKQEKQIFVDIACIFSGKKVKEGIRYWKRFNWDVHTAITNLELKSLIVIGDDDVLTMHSLLRDMGKAIRKEDETARLCFNRVPVLISRYKSSSKLRTNKSATVVESTIPGARNVQEEKRLMDAADLLYRYGTSPNLALNLL
ncbi:disease resistance protein L6-like [Cryptomeria japonica]|uniref:disease resistance protein L6-like n=1 Tax=Cryptomeria japonica TaxID=3369 RepID=UPI0027DAB474|nr:disease resistance protein L6-like [Cryptomeria japonica]